MADPNSSNDAQPTPSSINLYPSQNPTSPYYLHPNEYPGAILVSPPLNGDNFHSWSRAMRGALLTKNKDKFIDGTITVPAKDDPLFDTWERCNTLVISWIHGSLATHIAQSTVYIDNARSLWLNLQDRYSRGNHSMRIYDILQEIHSMRQGERTVSIFYNDLKILWNELESLCPTPSCVCNSPCPCDLTNSMKVHKENEYVICFLKGLNDSFNNVKTQILLLDPLPQINRVFALVTQEERKNLDLNIGDPNNGSWTPFPRPNNSQGSRGLGRNNGKQCTFCGHSFHTVDTCHYKHGFPSGYRSSTSDNRSEIHSHKTYR